MLMKIFVNGKAQELPDELSIAQLLLEMGVAHQRLAVELNREIVPRSAYGAQQLKPGDCLEMIHAVGGG